jgi:hypothetical protein
MGLDGYLNDWSIPLDATNRGDCCTLTCARAAALEKEGGETGGVVANFGSFALSYVPPVCIVSLAKLRYLYQRYARDL